MRFHSRRLLWLAMVVCSIARAEGASNGIRAALMTFTADDNSYRSTLAAADLAALVQAELSSDPRFQWVERDELKTTERELELSQLGLPDAAGALRRGRYTAADWIITGSFSVLTNRQWLLTVEVIDARRADVLAVRKTELSRVAHPTLKSALPQSAGIVSEVRAALDTAMRRFGEIRDRRTVMLLMLLDAEEIESELARTLENVSDGPNRWRVARVGRTRESFGQSELVLLGLVQQDADAWEKLADAYVWGRLAVRRPGDGEARLELTVWSREKDPRTISVSADRSEPPSAALTNLTQLSSHVATNLLAVLNARQAESSFADVRARMAQSLFVRAQEWRGDPQHWSKWRAEPDQWVREDIRQQIRILEAALLFDPGNQSANELLLRVQTASGWQFYSNRFWLLVKQSEAWGEYVGKFGFSSAPLGNVGVAWDTAPIAGGYVLSAFRLVDLSMLGNKEEYGFPRDMSGEIARRWLKGFTTELAKRAINTADSDITRSLATGILREGLTGNPRQLMMIDPKLRRRCIEALWPAFAQNVPPGSRPENYPEICQSISATYAELGLAGQEAKLLGMLHKPKPEVARTNAPVRLPRANELDPVPALRK